MNINNIKVYAIKTTSVSISWDAVDAGTSIIEYGLTSVYNLVTNEESLNFFHKTIINELIEGTQYHFRIKTKEYNKTETVSPDYTFTTKTQLQLESTIKAARLDNQLPKTYYVKTDGNDLNDGLTISTAWRKPSVAVSKTDVGDIIYLLDGTWYDELINFTRSGIDVAPITLKSYSDGGTPILYCTTPLTNTSIGIKIQQQSYINVVGITLRRYYYNIYVRTSNNVHISNCSVYTENMLTTTGTSLKGIGFIENAHDCSVNGCLIDGDAWNSISVGGRAWTSPSWSSLECYNISIENCVSCNNSEHALLDLYGISYRIYVNNCHLYNGLSSIYNHQGHPYNIYISNNNIHDCNQGIFFDGGLSYSVIEKNTINNIIAGSGGHSITTHTNETYETTFYSTKNIIRENYCRGDNYYSILLIEGTDILIYKNDIYSGYADVEYRTGGSNSIIRDAIGNMYVVMATTNTKIEYLNGRLFKHTGTEIVQHNNLGSYFYFNTGSRTITTYPIYAIPTTGSATFNVSTSNILLPNTTYNVKQNNIQLFIITTDNNETASLILTPLTNDRITITDQIETIKIDITIISTTAPSMLFTFGTPTNCPIPLCSITITPI